MRTPSKFIRAPLSTPRPLAIAAAASFNSLALRPITTSNSPNVSRGLRITVALGPVIDRFSPAIGRSGVANRIALPVGI